MKNIRILCISGSLRASSYNTAALHAIKLLTPDYIEIVIFKGISELPHFNPDIENDPVASISELQCAIYNADGLIIASPEYAHGIPGCLKNALDWLVGSEAFPFLPVALINTSPRAHHAQDALREVLLTMSANLMTNACMDIPLLGSRLDAHAIAAHPELSHKLLAMIDTFYQAIIFRH